MSTPNVKKSFSMISAIWCKFDDASAPLGYWMRPTQPQVHPLKATSWAAADKEVAKLEKDLPEGRKNWAYGETDRVVQNCKIKFEKVSS